MRSRHAFAGGLRPADSPQGSPQKIQCQRLLAHLALQLGDPSLRRIQLIARPFLLQRAFGQPPTTLERTPAVPLISPVIQPAALDLILSRQRTDRLSLLDSFHSALL